MATDRACEDAMHTSLPGSPPLSSNVGSPHGSGHDLDGIRMKNSMPFSQIFCTRGPVNHDKQSRFYDSMHASGICLGTIQAHTHVQLALACQQSMIRAQHRLRVIMQHVYGHGGNLGNECADHAAAFGTFGLISSHDVATRWIRHNIDTSVCFDGCNNISDILERLQHIRTNAKTSNQDRV